MARERDVLVVDSLGYAQGCGSGVQSLAPGQCAPPARELFESLGGLR